MQKQRLKLTRDRLNKDLSKACEESWKEPDNYFDKYIKPIEILRNAKIKATLKTSIFNLLKQEPEDGSKWLRLYVNIEDTWKDYTDACVKLYGFGRSTTDFDDIIDELEDDISRLLSISDEAWSWTTHVTHDNYIFDQFKVVKDTVLTDYYLQVAEPRKIKRSLA